MNDATFPANAGTPTHIVTLAAPTLPKIIANSGGNAGMRFLEFFTATIRNSNTRRAYAFAVTEFQAWCEHEQLCSLNDIQPVHVAAFVESLTRSRSAPTAKQRLAAIRHLFDWLVVGQVLRVNPASSVRGPSHRVRRGNAGPIGR